MDLFPTFISVAGSAPPEHDLHGVDLAVLFRDPTTRLAERELYWYLPGYSAFHTPSVMVRRGDWKLIRSLENDAVQLYDSANDIGEANDLSLQHRELTESLSKAATRWLNDLDAPRMTPNPEYESDSRK